MSLTARVEKKYITGNMKKVIMMSERFPSFLSPPLLRDGELTLSLVRTCPADTIKKHVPCYLFLMRSGQKGWPAGVLSLRLGNATEELYYPGHIGYRVRRSFRGRRYAERSVRMILPFAQRHGYRQIWISCRPDNPASRITCERNGGRLQEIVTIPGSHEMYHQGYRMACRYVIDLEEKEKAVQHGTAF